MSGTKISEQQWNIEKFNTQIVFFDSEPYSNGVTVKEELSELFWLWWYKLKLMAMHLYLWK